MASAVWVAFDRRFSGLTPRTGRETCGLRKASGRGARRFSGLPRSLGRMLSKTTGSGYFRYLIPEATERISFFSFQLSI